MNDRDRKWMVVGPDGCCRKQRNGEKTLRVALDRAKSMAELQAVVAATAASASASQR